MRNLIDTSKDILIKFLLDYKAEISLSSLYLVKLKNLKSDTYTPTLTKIKHKKLKWVVKFD